MKRLRPAIVALAAAAGAAALMPAVAAPAAATHAAIEAEPDDPRDDRGRGARAGERDGGVRRVAAAAPGVLAGPADLPVGTYGWDLPLRRATYAYRDAVKADLVVVFKGRRVLHLMRAGEVVGTYPIALGRKPLGHKLHEGDGRTPEGVYTLDWRNPNSRFHRSLHISYPAPRDRARAGRLGVHPGQDIMIHGLPEGHGGAAVGHPYLDWTEGCIAVTSEQIDDIWARVDDGTTIIIYP